MTTNNQTVKETQLKSWTGVAPGWRKYDAEFTRATTLATEKMLDAAGVAAGSKVLDIATGVGEPALTAARRVGPSGFVLATDFVEPMLAHAREKAAILGLENVEFRCVDGEQLDELDDSFDAVTIRWGIMFMPDAGLCLRGARSALDDGGRISVACWAGPELNPWATLPMNTLLRLAGMPKPTPGAPGIYAYADPGRLEAVLVEAGFKNVSIEAVDLPLIDHASFDEYWAWVSELVGPAASILGKLNEEQRASAFREVEEEVAKISPGGRVTLTGTTWVAAGEK